LAGGDFEAAWDIRIFAEYEDVLFRPKFRFRPDLVQPLLELIRADGFEVFPPPWPFRLPDPADEPFLAVAAEGGAILITGNARHFPERLRERVVVLAPADFLERHPPSRRPSSR
jgi:predicted nucleic acid-binding protein